MSLPVPAQCPCCANECQVVHVLVGDQGQPDFHHLKSPIPPGPTLNAFRAASTTYLDDEEFHIRLPALATRVFGHLIRYMNCLPMEDMDIHHINNDTHVSEWCVVYVLAVQFHLPDLAEESQLLYEQVRKPYWQGSWLPLPTEIGYLYSMEHSTRLLQSIVKHFVRLFFSHSARVNLRELASLSACHEDFAFDILRACQHHLNKSAASCEIWDCRLHHPWTSSDADFVERPSSTNTEYTATTESSESLRRVLGSSHEEDAVSEAAEILAGLRESVEGSRGPRSGEH
ncbi:uncharacterized protein PAC_03568 [Phialocephala subalpina]|uniref:BTB domain-containing protein n=1 Tax=Phialocephala subalpina TaxID=576137 RepID=A0A1L7WLP1_9HELO|nr:uncharacterized protein PAC_03568 [Phialocephala subalpina]